MSLVPTRPEIRTTSSAFLYFGHRILFCKGKLEYRRSSRYIEMRHWEIAMCYRTITILLLAAAVADEARSADILNPINGHYYRRGGVFAEEWELAKLAAFQQVRDGMRGHLVTITSGSELQFLRTNFRSTEGLWTGGFQPAGSSEPDGNWQWITGEEFAYTNWYPEGDPDNNGDAFVIEVNTSSGWWKDTPIVSANAPLKKGWIVEFTPTYIPKLDGVDFLNWQRTQGQSGLQLGDFDGDRLVDADDLALWESYYGGAPQPLASVPEPAALALAFASLMGIHMLRKSGRCG